MTEYNICVNCEHHQEAHAVHVCVHPDTKIVDVVTGSRHTPTCYDARGDEKLCGRWGRFYVERELPVPVFLRKLTVRKTRSKRK